MAFFSGMPREAAGPVEERFTPMVMSARAATADPTIDNMKSPKITCFI
jgi:hypothetical protein